MVTLETARQMALSMPGTVEQAHHGIPSFRANKKIFATLWIKEQRMMVKLSPVDQSVFYSFNPAIFFPVPNKWGLKGATFVDLNKVLPEMLEDALTIAWEGVIAKGDEKKKY